VSISVTAEWNEQYQIKSALRSLFPCNGTVGSANQNLNVRAGDMMSVTVQDAGAKGYTFEISNDRNNNWVRQVQLEHRKDIELFVNRNLGIDLSRLHSPEGWYYEGWDCGACSTRNFIVWFDAPQMQVLQDGSSIRGNKMLRSCNTCRVTYGLHSAAGYWCNITSGLARSK
jgi:hypothetical protein